MSEFEEVRRCASRREAEQLALVLAAVGIASRLVPLPTGVAIWTFAEEAEAARWQLETFERENAPRRRADAAAAQRVRGLARRPPLRHGPAVLLRRPAPRAVVAGLAERRRRAGGPDPGRPMVAHGHRPHPPRRPRPSARQPPGRRRDRHRHRPAARPGPRLARDPAGGQHRQRPGRPPARAPTTPRSAPPPPSSPPSASSRPTPASAAGSSATWACAAWHRWVPACCCWPISASAASAPMSARTWRDSRSGSAVGWALARWFDRVPRGPWAQWVYGGLAVSLVALAWELALGTG